MIFLRGTSGSGKSTVARWFMEQDWPVNPVLDPTGKRVEAYRVRLPGGKPLVILGRYETDCGGLDGTAKSFAHMTGLIQFYYQGDHILFERRVGSDVAWGTLGPFLAEYQCIHAFLDTPLEECMRRIKKRRELAGNTRPLNEENTHRHHAACVRAKWRLQTEFKQRVETIDHTQAPQQVYALLKPKLRKK